MNNTGFFFCGLLVGVVVSAAFGLDFFPTLAPEPGSGANVAAVAEGPDGQSAGVQPSEVAPTDRTQLVADLAAATLKVTSLEQKLASTESALQTKSAAVTTLEARLKALPPDEVQAKLDLAQIELEQERQQAKRLKADLELSHREAYNLLNQFFASKRSPEDAILVSEYFATSAPETFKGDLVDQLLLTNRDVIASLSPVSSLLAESRIEPPSGWVTPVSVKTGASGPKPAVLKEDQRGNLDPAQKNEASEGTSGDGISGDPAPDGKIPPGAVPDAERAVQLPPPPGE